MMVLFLEKSSFNFSTISKLHSIHGGSKQAKLHNNTRTLDILKQQIISPLLIISYKLKLLVLNFSGLSFGVLDRVETKYEGALVLDLFGFLFMIWFGFFFLFFLFFYI